MVLVTCVIISLIGAGQAFISMPSFLFYGSCSQVPVKTGLDLRKFAGKWYTAEKVANEYDNAELCINTDYVHYGDHMRTSQRGMTLNRKKQQLSTMLEFGDDPDPILTVHLEGMPSSPLKIVATDYEHYACMYSCVALMGFKAEFAFTLTRYAVPLQLSVDTCRDILQNESCPYWSTLPPNITELLQSRPPVLSYAQSLFENEKAADTTGNQILSDEKKRPVTMRRNIQHILMGYIKSRMQTTEQHRVTCCCLQCCYIV